MTSIGTDLQSAPFALHPVQHESSYIIVICGDRGVGKTSLASAFTEKSQWDWETPHEGFVAPWRKQFVFEDQQTASVEIQEVGPDARESGGPMDDSPIGKGDAFAFAYSVTSPPSFKAVEGFRKLVLGIKGNLECPTVVIGNKADLQYAREVSETEGQALATKYGCLFAETSAKQYTNVHTVFTGLVRRAIDHRKIEAAKQNDEQELTGCFGGCNVA